MKAEELMKQPDGILFYEVDITAPVIFQKVATVKNDITVRQFDNEFEQSRFGFREMLSADKNSKDFHVYTSDELLLLNDFFTQAYLIANQSA